MNMTARAARVIIGTGSTAAAFFNIFSLLN
jgi:hypothetical protein